MARTTVPRQPRNRNGSVGPETHQDQAEPFVAQTQPARGDPSDGDIVSLDELIVAYQCDGRPDYQAARRAYIRSNGSIMESYYAKNTRAGALLVRPPGLLDRIRTVRKIKARYDGAEAAAVQPAFEEALWRARALERESALVLSGQPRQVLIEMVYSIYIYLLSVLDVLKPSSTPFDDEMRDRLQAAINAANAELARLEKFKELSSRRVSLRWYLIGLPAGLGMAVIGGWQIVSAADSLASLDVPVTLVLLCLGAGSMGAVVSVMIRITRGQRLVVDSEQGMPVTVLAGAFRPLIGAIFGVVLYVMIRGTLIPVSVPDKPTLESFFFVGVAFLAGFSERWAQDTIVQSAPTLAVSPQDALTKKESPSLETRPETPAINPGEQSV